ncbi:AAA family ATPase [Marinobacterium jannaschii]|uniref:AAA family ATPase n=1 Tax=Marinobacterium jannaschii TaxID=64970 RepID=UPI0004859A01|nr:AAA family ATPase [Marinobacterium jannaschii]
MNPNLNSLLLPEEEQRPEHCQIMITGRTLPPLLFLQESVAMLSDVHSGIRLMPKGCADPLFGLDRLPDLLLLYLEEEALSVLQSIALRPECLRPDIIAVLPEPCPELLAEAAQLSLQRILIEPVSRTELIHEVSLTLDRVRQRAGRESALMTAFINARGGAGASMISAGIARALAAEHQRQTILMDMDLQSGSLSHYTGVKVRYGLRQALESVEQLDRQTLRDFMPQIDENLRLISARGPELLLCDEVTSERMQQLLTLLLHSSEHLVIDLPRHIDLLTSVVLERANRIVVVLEQTPEHLTEGVHLIRMLQDELDIAESRIMLVVNRCQHGGGFLLHEIEQTLPHLTICQIPNDYQAARDALACSQRRAEQREHSDMTRALYLLAQSIAAGRHLN